jgi:hypothetical protein
VLPNVEEGLWWVIFFYEGETTMPKKIGYGGKKPPKK